MGRYTSGGIGRDMLAGALAGGAAVWLINKMDWSLSHAGGKGSVSKAYEATARAAATRAADVAGVEMTEEQKTVAGHTVHYGVGIALGAFYGLVRGMAPSVTTGRGSLFGVATFILGDEIGAPALGLTKGPFDYAARDHAKSAGAHIVFGILTDLGTRLLSPWKSEVVITRGPSVGERLEGGRQAIADGRDYFAERGRSALDQGQSYLDRGRELIADYAEQARGQYDDLDVPGRIERGRKQARRFASDLSSNLPDADDLSGVVEQGRKRVRRFVDDVASRLPDGDDVNDAVETGRKRARDLARSAGKRLPDRGDVEDAVETGRSRAGGWLRGLANRLPDRDDVNDAVDEGRRRGRAAAKQARQRLPDRNDVDDAIDEGRKRVRRLANDAREGGSSLLDRASRWLFG